MRGRGGGVGEGEGSERGRGGRAKEVGKREEKRIIMWKKMWKKYNYIHVLSIIIDTGTL